MKTFRFDNLLGFLFFLLPLLTLLYYLFSEKIIKHGAFVSAISGFKQKKSWRVIAHYISVALLFIGLFVIAFSLTRPQHGIQREKIVSTGIDIVIALDTSPSMLIKDYKNNTRINVAKGILANFVDKRKNDRMGIVVFSTNSMIKSPATTNTDLLKRIISKIEIDPRKEGTTSIGVGMASAINRLIKLKDNTESKSKILILVTDGKNNSGEITPQAATDMAKQLGIKVYTVGIGSSEELDFELLGNIAKGTGGKFFHASTSNNIEEAFTEINQLEKQKIETVNFTRFKSIGYPIAAIGGLLFFLGLLGYSFLFRRLH